MSLRDSCAQKKVSGEAVHTPSRAASAHGNVISKTSCWRVGAERQKYLVDFSMARKKPARKKKTIGRKKPTLKKSAARKSAFRQEEDGEEGCAEKACRKKETGGQEEISCQRRNLLQEKPRVAARKSSIPLLPADVEVWARSPADSPAIRRDSHAEAMTILKAWKS